MSTRTDFSFPVYGVLPPHSHVVSEQIELLLRQGTEDDTRTPDDFWNDYFDEDAG